MTSTIADSEKARAFDPFAVLSEPTILVRVGGEKDEKKFYIHKQLLVAKSAYFQRALTSEGFKEGVTNEVVRRDIDSRAFAALMAWMYSGSWDSMAAMYADETPRLSQITDAYIVADRLFIDCKDSLLDLAADYFNSNEVPPSNNVIISAFDSLSSIDSYLRMLVDMWCKYSSIEIPEEGFSDLPIEFHYRVVSLMHRYSKAYLQFFFTDSYYYKSANSQKGDFADQDELLKTAWD
ncbi:hypothetical protein DM02DRAFT_648512 [Periconia macrospinosa]|uniref:BTB domain-containing protein n=1 Tax=Periconia macrospinosa TaxID=97972 RepID=A0A2V1EF32_9PLEO|nr:hypothetical protein DM02DRAFT_648512 [Periconia macrospinosa]